MNPTLSLIERMKVVGTDIERRKSSIPDRFLSHFYFGPDTSNSVSRFECSSSRARPIVTPFAGQTIGTGAKYTQRRHQTDAECSETAAPCSGA
jgi:hypothetical protein